MPDEKSSTNRNETMPDSGSDPRRALARSLDQLADLLDRLQDEDYTHTGLSGFDSSIGQHVRHCLDHVDALFVGLFGRSSKGKPSGEDLHGEKATDTSASSVSGSGERDHEGSAAPRDLSVAYDRRVRGTGIETERREGVTAARSRARIIASAHQLTLEDPLQILAVVDPEFPERRFASSCSRELLYVFHHTVHHLAIIAAQARCLGVGVDRDFGRAPATVAADRKN